MNTINEFQVNHFGHLSLTLIVFEERWPFALEDMSFNKTTIRLHKTNKNFRKYNTEGSHQKTTIKQIKKLAIC